MQRKRGSSWAPSSTVTTLWSTDEEVLMSQLLTLPEQVERLKRLIGETMGPLLDRVRSEGFPDASAEEIASFFTHYCKPSRGRGGAPGADGPQGKPGSSSSNNPVDAAPTTASSAKVGSEDTAPPSVAPRLNQSSLSQKTRSGERLSAIPRNGAAVPGPSSPPTIGRSIAEIVETYGKEEFLIGDLCDRVLSRYPDLKPESIRRTFLEMAPQAFVKIERGRYRKAM